MTEIIVLSDSNESVLYDEPEGEPKNVKKKKKHSHDDPDLSDFEFPEVQFHHAYDKVNAIKSPMHSPVFNTCVRLSQSNNKCGTTSKNSNKNNIKKSVYNATNSSDSARDSDDNNESTEKERKGKNVRKKNKNQLSEERLKRQQQLMKGRALKAVAAKKSKNLKPGECMKFMEVIIDEGINKFAPITDIVNALVEANLKYTITAELISNSITWRRSIEHNYVNEANIICTETKIEKTDHMLLIWNWDETVTKVDDGSFCTTICSIKSLVPDQKIILAIYGIEDYFKYRKQGRNISKNAKSKTQKNSRNNEEFKESPEISRRQLETCLNEVQITAGCSSRLVNNSQELVLMVYQCTKAIAEIPHKLEKNKHLTEKFDWYVMGDNRNTVKVDKDGNGLKRLWQQQLCQFNLSSLEIAEAICSVYPSPAGLIEAYMNCTNSEGINLLKDIPIRRAAGPLTTTRKVGPELSKKIYLMFMSEDGENVLN